MQAVHVGCSGWNYDDWRGRLYPRRLPQAAMAGCLRGAVFARSRSTPPSTDWPACDAVEGWVRDTPDAFVFAVKASRYLTHVRRLTDLDRGIHRFYAPLAPLVEAGKLGPVLWQLPETFRVTTSVWRGGWTRCPTGRHTIEFRHPSWFRRPVFDSAARAAGSR